MIEEYFKLTWCAKCKAQMTKKEISARKKENFLRLCDNCVKPIKESLKKCIPLMQKLKLG